MSKDNNIPVLVAHRGYMQRYPENTLPAIEAALQAGACYVEFDVQLSCDQVPMVLHDASLQRTAGRELVVFDLGLADLKRIEVNESERLGDRFSGVFIPTLAEAVELLAQWPGARAFVEIKRASCDKFGRALVVQKALEVLAPLAERAIVISFDRETLSIARDQGAAAIGWVIDEWSAQERARADELAPQYLFVDEEILPPGPEPLWPGPWQWAVYDVVDPQRALALAGRGAELIETMAIGEMLGHALLGRRRCTGR